MKRNEVLKGRWRPLNQEPVRKVSDPNHIRAERMKSAAKARLETL